ncbi:MAG: ABC transporter ATP-binding protein, partial [Treponemataceae bacterium]|nr:ABC transporter ATP-binding protein [Treponemataceae bacterium]
MFETLKNFFRFCDKENRNKFYSSIAVGVVNAVFMALRIAAVAVILQGVIGTAVEGHPFEVKTIYLSLGIMLVSILGSIITKKNTAMWQCEGGYRTCANKRIEIA